MPRALEPRKVLPALLPLALLTPPPQAAAEGITPTPPNDLPAVTVTQRLDSATGRTIKRRPLPSTTPSQTGSSLIKLAPTNVWSQEVATAPLASNSAGIAAYVATSIRDHWGGVAAFNAYSYNIGFHQVAPGTPRVDITWTDCQKLGWTPKGVYSEASHFLNVPVPQDATAAEGSDGAMGIYDPAADQLWEFWKMRKNATTGRWEACWGGRLDHVSTQLGQFPYPFGVSASGLVMSGGVINVEEVRGGRIDHAMYLGVIGPAHWKNISWPANRSDGYSTDPNAPMEGQRLRLDPTIDLSRYNLTPIGRMIAVAAQRYGFIVSDKSGAVGLSTESGTPYQAITGVNPWDELIGGPSYGVMKNFPWDKLQALPQDFGKPAR